MAGGNGRQRWLVRNGQRRAAARDSDLGYGYWAWSVGCYGVRRMRKGERGKGEGGISH